MKSTTSINLNLQLPNYSVAVYAVQGDTMSREIEAALFDGQTPFTPPAGALGTVRYYKPDGTSGFYDTLEDQTTVAVTWDDNVATIRLAEQTVTVPGEVLMQLSFYSADAERLSAFTFRLFVEKNPYSDQEFESTDYYSVLTARIAAVLGAVAHAPQINELGHWVLWDEEEQDYYDSGVDATGPPGPTGQTGPYMASIAKISGTGAPGTTDQYQVTLSNGTHPTGTISVYNGSDGQGAPGSATPLMDGTASAGSANAYAREDHRHPSDTTKANVAETVTNVSCTNGVLNQTKNGNSSEIVSIFNLVYPVGSIYMSVNDSSPSLLFGGTWERIEDRFLLAAGNDYAAGNTGGETTHALTSAEIGHKHTIPIGIDGPAVYKGADVLGDDVVTLSTSYFNFVNQYVTPGTSGPRRINTPSSGVTNVTATAHNNMPPYLAVNVWKRTA